MKKSVNGEGCQYSRIQELRGTFWCEDRGVGSDQECDVSKASHVEPAVRIPFFR